MAPSPKLVLVPYEKYQCLTAKTRPVKNPAKMTPPGQRDALKNRKNPYLRLPLKTKIFFFIYLFIRYLKRVHN